MTDAQAAAVLAELVELRSELAEIRAMVEALESDSPATERARAQRNYNLTRRYGDKPA